MHFHHPVAVNVPTVSPAPAARPAWAAGGRRAMARLLERWAWICVMIAVSLAVAGPASALVLPGGAVGMSNTTGEALINGPFTLGWKFSLNSPILVSGLGVFDSGQDGLKDSHEVGIFNAAGVLLASATVASGQANPLEAQFRYAPASVLLTPGQSYLIGAVWGPSSDELLMGSATNPTLNFVTAPEINWLSYAYTSSGSLTAPLTFGIDATESYFGPNFTYAAVVPEIDPASMGGVLALVVGALGVVERRCRKAA